MKTIHYTLHREDADYVAQCLDVEVSSFGATKEEAVRMLKEAIELYLEDPCGAEPVPHISDITVGEFALA